MNSWIQRFSWTPRKQLLLWIVVDRAHYTNQYDFSTGILFVAFLQYTRIRQREPSDFLSTVFYTDLLNLYRKFLIKNKQFISKMLASFAELYPQKTSWPKWKDYVWFISPKQTVKASTIVATLTLSTWCSVPILIQYLVFIMVKECKHCMPEQTFWIEAIISDKAWGPLFKYISHYQGILACNRVCETICNVHIWKLIANVIQKS